MAPLMLQSRLVPRVWGSARFGKHPELIGEVWLVHEDNLVLDGPGTGESLGAAVTQWGQSILGSYASHRGETTFPLLIKLIEASSWLSIQVHPTDDLARSLESENNRGKTEAWYVIDADQDSEIIAGVKPNVTQTQLSAAIHNDDVLELLQRHSVSRGDSIFLPAGTVHALGPGALIYEVQQSSDITYRVYDWDRPTSDGRQLHPEQSELAVDVHKTATPRQHPGLRPGGMQTLIQCDYFKLDRLLTSNTPVELAPNGESFQAITALEGAITLRSAAWHREIDANDTLVVPASSASYTIEGSGMVLMSSLPRPDPALLNRS